MDGAGRWAATCSVLPGDSKGAAWLWGFFLSLFKNPPSLASVGQLYRLIHSGEVEPGSGVGKGKDGKDYREDPSLHLCPPLSALGKCKDKVTRQGVT